jgi:hypothetical protein
MYLKRMQMIIYLLNIRQVKLITTLENLFGDNLITTYQFNTKYMLPQHEAEQCAFVSN